MIWPRPFVWPSVTTICKPPLNTTCSTILASLIELPVEIVPDVKQREFVSDTVPVSELPVWLIVADTDPLKPKVGTPRSVPAASNGNVLYDVEYRGRLSTSWRGIRHDDRERPRYAQVGLGQGDD